MFVTIGASCRAGLVQTHDFWSAAPYFKFSNCSDACCGDDRPVNIMQQDLKGHQEGVEDKDVMDQVVSYFVT